MLHARLRGRQAPAVLLAIVLAIALGFGPAIPVAHASRSDDIAAAEAHTAGGRHAEAARLYEAAAKRLFGWDVDVALNAAREYLAAGQPDDAERMIDRVARRARGEDAAQVAKLRADIAMARQTQAPKPATITPLPGEPAPGGPAPTPASPAAPVPGPAMLPSGAPSAVALLLPLTGRYRSAGLAVRDGFVAACLVDPADVRPRVAIYDTAANGVVASYHQAVTDGAQFVVGPLMKDELAVLVAGAQFPVPTLALNTLSGATPPAFLFQFSLDPAEEARAVARRIAADGHLRGIALFPENDWGRRVHDAFDEELANAGVTLSATQFYEPGARDFSAPLRAALGRFGGAGDRPDDKSKPPPKRDPLAEARDGPQFAFIAANAATARAIKPQLRFQMTYPVAVYATSDAWEASARAASDMEGLVYPEIPWVLYGGQGATELWDLLHGAWSDAGRGRLRLYAFGYDAFRLTGELRSAARSFGLAGLTGELDVTADGRVLRRMEWASIQGGRPQAAGASAPLPAPVASPGEP
jgi:outer membrane PBP1 activator LpoA protein